ncbi:hypothetical protein [Cohnella soli]|uniref:Diguanylate cyclase n=1 Tax=Cohnella soli TaxID=425005 RepID=A0ABW0I184_9BACL
MHVNLYIYQNHNKDVLALYHAAVSIERAFALEFKHFDYYYLLPEEKANHPGDIGVKSVRRKKLEDGIASGEIRSFNMSNSTDLREQHTYAIYVNDESHGGTTNISLHFPRKYSYELQAMFENMVDLSRATYAFQIETDSALKGVSYMFTSTVYRNEKINFSSYLLNNDKISQPRMMYPVNYFTETQLSHSHDAVTFRDFINAYFGADALKSLGTDIFVLKIDFEKLSEVNNDFGEAGFLISWIETRRRTK